MSTISDITTSTVYYSASGGVGCTTVSAAHCFCVDTPTILVSTQHDPLDIYAVPRPDDRTSQFQTVVAAEPRIELVCDPNFKPRDLECILKQSELDKPAQSIVFDLPHASPELLEEITRLLPQTTLCLVMRNTFASERNATEKSKLVQPHENIVLMLPGFPLRRSEFDEVLVKPNYLDWDVRIARAQDAGLWCERFQQVHRDHHRSTRPYVELFDGILNRAQERQ